MAGTGSVRTESLPFRKVFKNGYNSNMSNLLSKKCAPCERNTAPLDEETTEKFLTQVVGWEVLDGKKLYRNFEFKNFKEAIDFVNKVAGLAESGGHHPDILIHSWNKVKIELWTHTIGGLSENDFILAAKINDLIQTEAKH